MNCFAKSFKSIAFQEKLFFLMIFFAFVLFPTNNSSLDAYHYASNIRYGEELFLPHHLLYSACIYLLYQPFASFGIDVLSFSKIINATFSVLGLYLLYHILGQLKLSRKETVLYTLIVAFSFSFWRYGTENETYIIPIFFSLFASYHYVKYLNSPRPIFLFLCGLSATLACLFHQLHFFWWLGLFIGLALNVKKIKPIILYASTALIVPMVYVLVLVLVNNQELSLDNILQFVFHDFYTGSAKNEFGWQNFFFIFLNSVRTFFEVHPVIALLIKRNLLFVVPLLAMLFLVFKSIKCSIQKKLILKRTEVNTSFVITHAIILVLQFLFAFYAVGNIEFMVVVPFLMVLTLLVRYKINFKIVSMFAVTLFVWNFGYAIYPNNQYKYYNDEVLLDFIIQHPKDVFLVKNEDLLNKFYYKTGIDNYKNIVLADKIKSKKELQKLFNNKKYIYTDIINKPIVFNRGRVISANALKLDFNGFKKEKIFRYNGLYGNSTIYKISRNSEIPQ